MKELHNLPCFDPECGGQSSCSFFLKNKEGNYAPHLHCFKCNKQQWNVSDEDYLMLDATGTTNLVQLPEKKTIPFVRGIVSSMPERYIGKASAEKYGIERLFKGDNPYGYAFPARDIGGQTLIAQKVKHNDGSASYWTGEGGVKRTQLFGQHLFPAGGRYLTITEGEEDCAAAYQMLREQSSNFDTPVVSLMYGAGTAAKECKEHWEYINSFENIIIAFDGDEVGRKASEEVAKLFHFRPKIVLFGECKKDAEGKYQWKDANDYLKGKREKDFINLWWRAERFTPRGVKTFNSLWEDMIKSDTNTRVDYPWKGLNNKLHGLITGHLVIIKAPPKVGKTSVLKEIIYHIHTTTPHNVGIIFLENTKKEIGMGLCALHLNKKMSPWDIPDNLEELQTAHLELSKEDRLTVFDPEDSRTVENILTKILYFVKAHNCKFIFLDHITMLAYQSGSDNERQFLDKLCADLKEKTTGLDICIVAVTHVNDEGKTRGSRAAVQLCDSMISLERDKTSEDPVTANTTEVIVEDNRWGECGLACKLFYDQTTGRMTELDTDLVFDT